LTFFPTGTRSDSTEASGPARTGAGASAPRRDSCPKTVSAGTIAGSVVGGLFILVAGAVGLGYMLRQTRKTAPVPVPVGPLDETKLNNTAPGSPGSPGSANPLFGHFPATQHQQPTTELPS
jgi:predicted secreted protein